MARRAVAATLASVVLLSLLVVADATIVSAQDNLAAGSQLSRVETRELVLEQALMGSLSMGVLAQAQSFLSTNPATCGEFEGYVGSISASSSSSGDDSGTSYVANATGVGDAGPSSPAADNLTVVSPFSGGAEGALDMRVAFSIREVGGGGSVLLERHETHVLNVPVRLGDAALLCASAQDALGSALSRSPCNSTLVQAAFGATLPGLMTEASALGFVLTAGLVWGAVCAPSYWFKLVELGVPGATGSFDWTVVGSGPAASA